MTTPVRLQLSRKRGFDLQALSLATNLLPAVNVARPSRWGNPYVVGEPVDKAQVRRWGWKFKHTDLVCADADEAVRRFRACLAFDEAIHDGVRHHLADKNLACWCPPGAWCHADVLLDLVTRPTECR